MHARRLWSWLMLSSLLLVAGAAHAQSSNLAVYLNDVRLEGGEVKGLTLSNVDVRFDEKGDLHIVAKGYKITAEPVAGSGMRPGSATGKHYYIVPTKQQRVGAAQWEVDIYVNQNFVHKFRSKDPDPLFDITQWLHTGSNALQFVARKEPGERVSTSPVDVFELVIGNGELNQGQLMLNKLSTYKRTAAETGEFKTNMTLDVPNL